LRAGKTWFVPSEAVAVPAGFAQHVTALAFEQSAPRESQDAPVLAHLPGGGGGAILGGPDRFVVRMAAVAAGILAVLGLALYNQGVNHDGDLIADTQSFEELIQQMDAANEEVQPATETTDSKTVPQEDEAK